MDPNTSKALVSIITGLLIPVGLRVKRQRAERKAAALRQTVPPARQSNGLLFIIAALAVLAALLLLDARRP